jgi:serine/threonine protein kinase
VLTPGMMRLVVDNITAIGDTIYVKDNGYCTVYKGLYMNKVVVIKTVVLNLETDQEIKREKRGLRIIRDSSPQLHQMQQLLFEFYYLEKGFHVFCTKYYGNVTLSQYIRHPTQHNASWTQTSRILLLLGSALKEAKKVDIILNDWKPDNLMIVFNENNIVYNIMVIDMGSCDIHDGVVSSNTSIKPSSTSHTSCIIPTKKIQALGTPGYICPSRTDDIKSQSPACDVFRYFMYYHYLIIFTV